MKKVLSILAVIAIAASFGTAKAQETENLDGHWFIQLQGGAAHTIGEADFKDLLSPAAAVSIGYQFSPVFALRANGSGWQAKGALVGYDPYKFNYAQGSIDALVSLDNLLGRKTFSRTLSPYLLAGAGLNLGARNGEANALASKFPADNYLWSGKKLFPAARGGAGLNIRLTDAVALNLEAVTDFISDHFNSKVGSKVDFQINALAGLTIRFGRKKAAPVVEEVIPTPPPAPAPAPAPKPQPKPEPKPEPAPAPAPAPVFQPMTQNILFEINKSVIRSSEQPKIDAIVEFLKANPETKVSISGYADKATGNANINRRLSEQRCAAVAKAIEAAGIAKDRISTSAFGDTVNPFATPEANRVAVCVADK